MTDLINTPREQAAYDAGYQDGGNSNDFDWVYALTDDETLPDHINPEPHEVKAYITHLQRLIREAWPCIDNAASDSELSKQMLEVVRHHPLLP